MMYRHLLTLLPIAAACGPSEPASTESAGDSTGAPTSSSSTSTGGSTGTTDTNTGEPTSSTTAGTVGSSGDSTTSVLPECSWYWPEYQGTEFCPAPADMTADIAGTTPNGPISLRFAQFGLFLCTSCPHADNGALRLYADPPTLGEPVGDFLDFLWITSSSLELGGYQGLGQIGGQDIDVLPADVTLADAVLPPVEQTSPPLDETMPPVLSGTLHLTGNGWDVHGTFTAPLCTALNWTPPCE